jgi:3-oxoacyl-[acyl-carrier-protein] synthase II
VSNTNSPAPRRVVVTGMGVVTPLGIGLEKFWASLIAGKSGITPLSIIAREQAGASKVAGQIYDFEPLNYVDAKTAKRMERFSQLAAAASAMARKDANLDAANIDPTRVGLVIGCAGGGYQAVERNLTVMLEKGPRSCSPFFLPMFLVNMAAGWVSILNNIKGPSSCTVTACATSSNAIGDAFKIIQNEEAEVMYAGGTEAPITALVMAAFAVARALSTRNHDPERASRPFDVARDGFVMSEGAATLILESLEHAQARNAKIYAELVGYGQSADAFDIVAPAPDGEGAQRAMRLALKDAGMQPEEISYLNAHATSTPVGDTAETAAIKGVFKDFAYKLPVSATKSMTGHMLGAAGGVEAAICILAMQHGSLPPTINLDNPDPRCDLDYIPHKARHNVKVDAVMSNSFGFGGHNTTLIFKRFAK